MKKQITLALSAMLFAGSCLHAQDVATAVTPVVPTPVEVVAPAVQLPEAPVVDASAVTPAVSTETPVVTTDAAPAVTDATKPADVVPAKKSYVPTFAQAKTWCADHKLVVGGAAITIGFVVLWKTCPAFRAFFGVEDEQEETKFVY